MVQRRNRRVEELVEMKDSFYLDKIIDSHSGMKSEIAKDLIRGEIESFDVIYCTATVGDCKKCHNHITKTIECSQSICDVFVVVHHETGESFNIGNTCIADFVKHGLLSNVSYPILKYILKQLKINNICFLCEKKCSKGYHMSCMQGKSTNIVKDLSVIEERYKQRWDLKGHLLFQKAKCLSGLPLIKKLVRYQEMGKPFTQKDYNTLKELIEQYYIIFDNLDKFLRFQYNCIIESIKRQQRKPSVKQLNMLVQVFNDYERILAIDDRVDSNMCSGYESDCYFRFGYVFPRKQDVL